MPHEASSARQILERYAAAWRGAEEFPLGQQRVLAFWVAGGGEFHVVLSDRPGGSVGEGIPARWDDGFELDLELLRRLDRGEINALTAMGQAHGSDPIPLRPKLPAGFQWTPEARGFLLPFWFHFWTREWPERIPFGEGTTRPIHGGHATAFFYDAAVRSAFYQLKPGSHINADPRSQIDEIPNIVIVTRGRFHARLAGVERIVAEGEAFYISPGTRHEFWASPQEYGEFVLIMLEAAKAAPRLPASSP